MSSTPTALDRLHPSTNSPSSSYGTLSSHLMSYTNIPSIASDDAEIENGISNGDGGEDVEVDEISTTAVNKNGYVPLDKYGRPALMGQSTLYACTANLANTILGAGMLGLPHAFANSGYILGVVLLVVSGCASAFGLHLLSASARIATPKGTPSSFYSLAHAAVPRATIIIDGAVAIKCFGVATSYLIVVGDLMPPAAEQIFGSSAPSIILNRRFWIALFAVAFCIPLSCLRTLNALRFTSSLSIGFVWYLVTLITVYATVPSVDECSGVPVDVCKGPTHLIKFDFGTLKVLSIFIFGFTCHQNIFAVYNEIKDNTQARINRVVLIAISLAMAVYCVIASMGYHAYGSKVDSNILKNLPSNNVFVTISRILISMLVTFCYPLQTHPCRTSILSIMSSFRRSESIIPLLPSQQFRRATIVTAIICAASFGVAMAVTDLGVVLAMVGATGSTMISYILPGLTYVKLHQNQPRTPKLIAAWVQLIAGCIIIPACLTFIFI